MSNIPSDFNDLFDALAAPVVAIDEAGLITYYNQALREYFNLSDIEIGIPLTSVIAHPDLLRLIARDESQGEIYLGEFERYLNVELSHVKGLGTLVNMQDITHLKKSEKNRSLLVSDISRNLRSPLTAIVGYAELLPRMGDLNEQQANFVDRINVSVDSMKRLINDLTELEHVENTGEISAQEVDLRMIVRYSVDGLYDVIERKNIDFSLSMPQDIPMIHGNPIRLRQVVNNLLQNALQYSPEGEEIEIKIWVEDEVVFLSVEDTGIGIPEEDQPHIFNKFYRASNISGFETKSGLGLSIVKNIVELHGGRVWVESQESRGSSFTLMLPSIAE